MDTETYVQIQQAVRRLLNINLTYYKDEQMRRRLDSWLVRSGAESWTAYFSRLRVDEDEGARFRDYLTINVSSFFRDSDRWRSLKETILPALLPNASPKESAPRALRVWSAGCSNGAEAYSLLILLDELSAARRATLLATDLDRSILVKARNGGPYTQEDVQNLTPNQRSAALQPAGQLASPPFYVKQSLVKRVHFVEQNLLSDPFETDFDLIVCRNVVIYFTLTAKTMLYQKFLAALRPGGVLFVGATEVIPRPQDIGFRSIGVSFYQKG